MNARNRDIVEARAAGRTIQSIALEHGLSLARVSKILQDHQKDVRIAELEREVTRLRDIVTDMSARLFPRSPGAAQALLHSAPLVERKPKKAYFFVAPDGSHAGEAVWDDESGRFRLKPDLPAR